MVTPEREKNSDNQTQSDNQGQQSNTPPPSTWVTVNTSDSSEMQRMEIQKGEDGGPIIRKDSE